MTNKLKRCVDCICDADSQVDESGLNGMWGEDRPPEHAFRTRHKSYKAAGWLPHFPCRVRRHCITPEYTNTPANAWTNESLCKKQEPIKCMLVRQALQVNKSSESTFSHRIHAV